MVLTTLLAFLLALAVLIAVHEYGHYRVAVACGVKVLRFSIGFGKPLLHWQGRSGTEFVVCALPLGGYVRMLDEREGPVDPSERHMAFNTQPLRARAAIVSAGPLANLLLAIALYSGVAWLGVEEAEPVLSRPVPGSLAEKAGLRGKEWVLQAAQDGQEPESVSSFEDVQWRITRAVLDQQDLSLWVASGPEAVAREVKLPLAELEVAEVDAALLRRIGILVPWSAPLIAEMDPNGAAARAGLHAGDVVLRIEQTPVQDSQHLRQLIQAAVGADGQTVTQTWHIQRQGQTVTLAVVPAAQRQDGHWVGRIGAYVGAEPAHKLVQRGLIDGLAQGLQRTWDIASLSLKMMGKMLLGEASVKNLSGPLSIADFAGKSASMGLTAYLAFLAAISVSLGVLNLLPIPVLDGGHLMYYLWEAVTGRPVPEVWMERLQRGGIAVLLALMSLAMFNDVARLLG